MADSSIGPGTVLAGRYRLDDLMSEAAQARLWRATDTALARSVAVTLLAADDSRAEALLVAARTSATVTDEHFLRVLDAASEEGVAYVVHEWGSGISLDRLLTDGPLAARRSAWLVKEVAEAITTAHRQGIVHGRLVPENVLISEAGSVRLIGFVVDAVLHDDVAPSDLPSDLPSDVLDLGALLYAALVARWPGTQESSVPAAPREHGHPLRPRQVKAGVPRFLDSLCDRVLNGEAQHHAGAVSTAHEVSAALSRFIGDPTGAASFGYDTTGTQHITTPATGEPETTGESETTDREGTDPEATQVGTPVFYDDDTDVGWLSPESGGEPTDGHGEDEAGSRPSREPPPPPPEPEPKPLFAPDPPNGDGPQRERGRRGPHGGPWTGSGTGSAPPARPWEDEQVGRAEDTAEERHDAGKNWLRLAGFLVLCVALVLAVIVAFNLGRGSGGPGGSAQQSPSAGGSPGGAPTRLRIADVNDFDPQADPPEENPDEVGRATDGDPSTAWHTMTYYNNPKLGLLKDGVGLVLDLGKPQRVGDVRLRMQGSPTDLSLYAAGKGAPAPSGIGGLTRVASASGAGTRVDLQLDKPVSTRYLVVWLTSLPPSSGGYRGGVAEVVVRS